MSSISFPHAGHRRSDSSSSSHHHDDSLSSSYYASPSYELEGGPLHSSSSSSSHTVGGGIGGGFQINPASSGFQMNPLSSHPPRSPRTSMISSGSQNYASGSLYGSKGEGDFMGGKGEQEEEVASVAGESEEDDERNKEMESRVRKEEIWKLIFDSSTGRDKAFKVMQYSIRVFLAFHSQLFSSPLLKRPTRPGWETEALERLRKAASAFSLTRKLLILFNWLTPLTMITAQQSVPFSAEDGAHSKGKKPPSKPFLHTALNAPPTVLINFVNCLAEDVSTLARMSLVGTKTGRRAERISAWCWLASILAALVENGVERQMIGNLQHHVESRMYTESMSGKTAKSMPKASKVDERELRRLQKRSYWLQITRTKLVMDLIFVSYDIFKIQRATEIVMTTTGLVSAVLSTAKLYDGHKNTLMKSLSF